MLILVPEIGLTPQMIDRFVTRFGDTVAVLHSSSAPGSATTSGAACARARRESVSGRAAAVFAPIAHLGLVVVDEEHDGSYKNEGDPRYDARLVAERRAGQHGAVLVCGSATPRPESVYALQRIRLPRRVDGSPMPPVEIVDLKAAAGAVHPRTHEALIDARKAIVLLNRRGWSNFLTCRSCGRVWECPDCDVALILHRDQGAVACHHCGHRERVPKTCPDCGSVSIARHGTGTERLEHDLASLGKPVLRLDADIQRRGCRAERAFDAAPSGRSWSARRWWPRATTSRTSTWASCSTPTRPCASRTSAPRSARSRSSHSSPAGRAAARARPRDRPDHRSRPPAPSSRRGDPRRDGFLAEELARRQASCATRRSRR